MLIDPRRLSHLLAVHRHGGVVAAADVLGLTPSAVSQQIRKLEEEVGLPLVERTPQGARITPAGHILVAGAQRIENELSEIAHDLRPMSGAVTGTLGIGAFQTVIRSVLLPLTAELSTTLPGVEVHIKETDEADGMGDLRAGRIDLLMLERDTAPGTPPTGFSDTAFIDEPWVLLSPENAPRVQTERDLAKVQWLRLAPQTIGYHAMQRIASSIPQAHWVPYEYINYEAAHALVRAGCGSTLLPSMAVRGIPLDGMRITRLPGFGFRRILVRHRKGEDRENSATGQVLTALFSFVAQHHEDWRKATG